MSNFWTPRRTAKLTELWLAGWSARRIARFIGTSANAVVGKSNRLHLPRRANPVDRSRAKAKVTRLPLSQAKDRSLGKHRALLAVFRHGGHRFATCQWIAGEPTIDDSCKCGAPTLKGAPYCADHWARAWRPRPRPTDQDTFEAA